MKIKVIQPGALTTVQDLGRYGFQEAGMPAGGVMDTRAFALANRLVGNNGGEAVLELTLFGGMYQFEGDGFFSLTGANMAPTLNGAPCPMNRAVAVRDGDTLMLGFAKSGCRAYLAVAGGIDVPPVMGSRSTNLKCKIGGFAGRALQPQDVLAVGASSFSPEDVAPAQAQAAPCDYPEQITVRVIEGPQADYFTEKGLETFYSAVYTVSEQSDRMGCRMEGPAVESLHGTDIISDGIVFGSIQVTSSGQPIILMADRQTTGGYAKIGTVCTADLSALAQCRPGNTVRFARISVEEAQALLRNADA